MHALEERLKTHSGGNILDVATGEGGFIHFLLETFTDYNGVIGVDISDKHFTKALEKFEGKNVTFLTMDAARLSFDDNTFDTVTIANSLHHLPDIPAALSEMKRVLKPGGTMFIYEMFRDNQTDLQMTHVLLHHWWARVNRLEGITHNETFTRDQIVEMAENLKLSRYEFYDYVDPDTNPQDKETRDYLDRIIDDYLDKLNGHAEGKALKAEGQQLRRRLHDIGLAWATELAVVAVK